ncbi:VTT domain-containing protein [Alkalihalophilus pseudofirmus]|uniref:TVP38/TMEM64 family membrane protein n=1 Tax=Alkalihalophilus pseudofirmus TaxID=79885 RepID=A0AAJ2NNX2_ALKPS|nr:VTT domain-containing protein [Alkalihalophilus pseudofirmus]MDV2885883.1 VTT domain-containing protein [Alkalihalophilus pseudofirmus]
MNEFLDRSLSFIEQSGWLAPLFFILLHVFRQAFFIPVLIVCLIGGYLFGTLYGSIYSIIGLTAVSVVFYGLVRIAPGLKRKLTNIKQHFFKGRQDWNLPQMMIIRMMPLVHFHVVSLYLIETSKGLKEYTKKSFLVSIPPAILYTAFGDMIHELPLAGTIVFAGFLLLLFMLFRKKQSSMSWEEFFQTKKP